MHWNRLKNNGASPVVKMFHHGFINEILIISIILVAFLCRNVSSNCITVHVFGQKTADCKNSKLQSLPNYLPPDIKVLEFHNNDLKVLTADAFQSYQALQEIYLTGNKIEEIHTQAFRGLLNLQTLDLESNQLSSVPSKALRNIPYLRTLSLKHNNLNSIDGTAFWATPYLEKLNLQNCNLERIVPNSFDGLKKLNELILVDNKLQGLDSKMEEKMPPVLQILRLHKNPWRCDCKLRWIKSWLSVKDIDWHFGSSTPECASPQPNKGQKWEVLKVEKFACPPLVTTPNVTDFAVAISRHVTLSCEITADPPAEVQWFKGKDKTQLQNGSKYSITMTGIERIITKLTILNTNNSDIGRYKCIASNFAGTDHKRFIMRLYVPTSTVTIPVKSGGSGDQTNGGSGDSSNSTDDISLGHAPIIGIAVGASLFILLLVCFICYGLKRRNKRNTYKVRDYKKPQKGKKKKVPTATLR